MTATMTKITTNPEIPSTFYAYDGFDAKFNEGRGRYKERRMTRARLEQAAEDLDAAAKLLRVNNWTQGSWCDEQGKMCAQGAIGKVASGQPLDNKSPRARAAIAIADSVVFTRDDQFEPLTPSSILDFNDMWIFREGETEKKHVAKIRKALRTAARAARAKAASMKR